MTEVAFSWSFCFYKAVVHHAEKNKTRCRNNSASRFFTIHYPLSTINFSDDASADHDIPIIEDHRLSNGQRPHRLIKDDLHTAIGQDGGGAGGLFGLIPVLRLAADRLGGGGDGGPVEGVRDQAGGEQLRIAAQHHLILLHILRQHIHPPIEALAQATPLSDGVADRAQMVADDLAGFVHKVTGGVGAAGVLLKKMHIVPALIAMDRVGRVIYMNTFSKTLAPSIRISYMILPHALMERFRRTLGFYSCTVPSFEQYTLARFLSGGWFEKHINRMRQFYRTRRNRVIDILNSSPFAGRITIFEQDAGLHFLLRVDSDRTDRELVALCAQAGIRVRCLGDYYEGQVPAWAEKCLVINYSGLEEDTLAPALERLAGIVG